MLRVGARWTCRIGWREKNQGKRLAPVRALHRKFETESGSGRGPTRHDTTPPGRRHRVASDLRIVRLFPIPPTADRRDGKGRVRHVSLLLRSDPASRLQAPPPPGLGIDRSSCGAARRHPYVAAARGPRRGFSPLELELGPGMASPRRDETSHMTTNRAGRRRLP
jgi:hypothetical protein